MKDHNSEDLASNFGYSTKLLENNDTQDIAPDLCNTIDRENTLVKCLDAINKTCIQGSKQKACVCVICDSFIIGTEKVCWLKEEQLQQKNSVLSVSYLESNAGASCIIEKRRYKNQKYNPTRISN